MTSLSTLTKIASLVPEMSEVFKASDLEKSFATNSRDSTLSSAVQIHYLTKVAGETVDLDVRAKVSKAVDLYGLNDKVAEMTSGLKKEASSSAPAVTLDMVKSAELYFETNLSGFLDLEKAAGQAESLVDNFGKDVTSESVKRYAGEYQLNKEAAVEALIGRFKLTNEAEFLKIAKVVDSSKTDAFDSDDNRLVARAVTVLDKQAGLHKKGYNFYKEAFMSKQAYEMTMPVRVGGRDIPYESIVKNAAIIEQIIGSKLPAEPSEAKAVVESLPMDLHSVLLKYV